MLKISILGKILLLILVPIFAYSASATLDKIAVLKGEAVTLSLSASGNNMTFPQLKTVEGNKVISTSTSSSITIINGSMKRSKTVSYTFVPKYSFTIPVYSVIVDGDEEHTNKIKLKVVEPQASKIGDILQLDVKFSKDTAYVGEDIICTFTFKYKVGTPLLNIDLEDFAPKHFVIKPLKQEEPYEENGYVIIKQDFLMFPQLAGNYLIDKQVINVALREYRTNLTRWNKVFSNENKLTIKTLPNNIHIQGDYTIEASVDKLNTKSNLPINLTLKIKGSGNIDDIDEFKIELENEVVYSSKPTIKTYLKDGKYMGEFTQNISIIADNDFTIPSIEFKYFDTKNKKVKTIKTKSFDIKVKTIKHQAPIIQTKNKIETIQLPPKIIIQKEDSYIKYVFAIIGLFVGVIGTYLILKKKEKRKVSRPLEVSIKKSKNDKILYNILLPYSFNENILIYIKLLEENIYNNGKNKIDKRKLIEVLEDEDLISS